jgi:hypothetical protein
MKLTVGYPISNLGIALAQLALSRHCAQPAAVCAMAALIATVFAALFTIYSFTLVFLIFTSLLWFLKAVDRLLLVEIVWPLHYYLQFLTTIGMLNRVDSVALPFRD